MAPGFIDAHTHDDRAVLSSPDMTPKISQGVTSVVTGNCGVSLAPFVGSEPPPPMNLLGDDQWYRFATMREYMAEVEASPPALNLAPLVGHTALRAAAMDDVYRAASAAENHPHGGIARRGARGRLHRPEHRTRLSTRGRSPHRRGRDAREPARRPWRYLRNPYARRKGRESSIRYRKHSRSASVRTSPWLSRTTSATAGRAGE